MSQPPYGDIADLLKRGEVVPFLGAGVNFGIRAPDEAWNSKAPRFPPTGKELSQFLASMSSFPSLDMHDISDLSKVSSYCVETSGRRQLRERLREVFDRDFAPCDIHDYLANVAGPLLIVTTNYDDLTEKSFTRAGKPYDLVIHPTDRKDVEASVLWWKYGDPEPQPVAPNRLFIDLRKTTVIYKMHGTVDRALRKWHSYVITEEDYVNFLSRMTSQTAVPAVFMRHFSTRHFLFLGYGLRDWNLRVVLKNLKAPLPATPGGSLNETVTYDDEKPVSWAIQYSPEPWEMELWRARGVKIYDVEINEFTRRLREQDAA